MAKKMIFTAPKGEKIVFDNWETDKEYDGYWVDLCPDCIKKYGHILENKLDDAGSGVASCSVCGCSNTNAGCYADFKENEVSFEESSPEIVGIITQYGEDDFSLWENFSLTPEEREKIQNVLHHHETEGRSVRGSKEEILAYISNSERTMQ